VRSAFFLLLLFYGSSLVRGSIGMIGWIGGVDIILYDQRQQRFDDSIEVCCSDGSDRGLVLVVFG